MNTKWTLKQTNANMMTLNVNLVPKKTLYNKEFKELAAGSSTGKKEENVQNVPINSVCFNQNEKFQKQFATVDKSGRLALWDAKKGAKIVEEAKAMNGMLMTCAIESREGQLIACGGMDTKLHIYRINPQGRKKEKLSLMEKEKELCGHYGLITCCGFLDRQYLISGSNDSSIMLWDLEKPGRFLVKYGDHQSEVLSVDVFNLDSNICVSGSNDATAMVWDIRQKTPCIRIFDKSKCGVSAVKFMPDCVHSIAIGCDDSSIKMYDLRAVGKIGRYKEESSFESVQRLEFSTSGRLLFSSYNNNRIKVWDIVNEKRVSQLQG